MILSVLFICVTNDEFPLPTVLVQIMLLQIFFKSSHIFVWKEKSKYSIQTIAENESKSETDSENESESESESAYLMYPPGVFFAS